MQYPKHPKQTVAIDQTPSNHCSSLRHVRSLYGRTHIFMYTSIYLYISLNLHILINIFIHSFLNRKNYFITTIFNTKLFHPDQIQGDDGFGVSFDTDLLDLIVCPWRFASPGAPDGCVKKTGWLTGKWLCQVRRFDDLLTRSCFQCAICLVNALWIIHKVKSTISCWVSDLTLVRSIFYIPTRTLVVLVVLSIFPPHPWLLLTTFHTPIAREVPKSQSESLTQFELPLLFHQRRVRHVVEELGKHRVEGQDFIPGCVGS